MRRAVRLVALMLVTLSAAECTPPTPAPGAKEVLAAFGEPWEIEQGAPPRRLPLHIYLDASQSMQGFMSTDSGRFRRVLDNLLDRSVAGGYDVSVYRFDQVVERLPATTSVSQLAVPEFFSGAETSFPALFQHIRKTRQPGAIAIVITDLVQSGKSGDQKELSRAFQEMSGSRPDVLLVAMRSPFRGTYWPEARSGWKFSVNLPGIDPRSSRPFYLLAIADQHAELDELDRRLSLPNDDHDITSWRIDASSPAVVVESIEPGRAKGDEGEAIWQRYRNPEAIPAVGRAPRRAFWFFETSSRVRSASPVRFTLSTQGRIGVASLERIALGARRCRFVNNTRCRAVEAFQTSSQTLLSSDDTLSVSIALPAPPDRAWDAYQLKLLPGRANLERPINPELWTTNDDSDPAQITRTFKLDLFIDTLVTALREPVAIAELYVVLGRGE